MHEILGCNTVQGHQGHYSKVKAIPANLINIHKPCYIIPGSLRARHLANRPLNWPISCSLLNKRHASNSIAIPCYLSSCDNSKLLTPPLKFWSSVFRVSTEMENWYRPLCKIRKMALTPQKCILEQNGVGHIRTSQHV